jgi:hypothetical protein
LKWERTLYSRISVPSNAPSIMNSDYVALFFFFVWQRDCDANPISLVHYERICRCRYLKIRIEIRTNCICLHVEPASIEL